MEIKSLKASDLFIVTSIISKIGIKEIAKCFKDDSVKEAIATNQGVEAIGMSVLFEIISVITAHLKDCEDLLYKLVSNLTGIKEKEIANMDGVDFVDLLIKIIMNPKNKDFFKLASRFIPSQTK